jgi:hypothetical protein
MEVGNKPDLESLINDGTGEPMSSMPSKAAEVAHAPVDGVPMVTPSGLSAEAKAAILAKKKKRVYGQFDPK